MADTRQVRTITDAPAKRIRPPLSSFFSFLPAEFLQRAFQGAIVVSHYKRLALSKPIKTGFKLATLQPISYSNESQAERAGSEAWGDAVVTTVLRQYCDSYSRPARCLSSESCSCKVQAHLLMLIRRDVVFMILVTCLFPV